MQGATQAVAGGGVPDKISIRAPLAGSDNAEAEPVVLYKDFNPRSPCGERPAPAVVAARLGVISIRAPLTGSDSGQSDLFMTTSVFQSALPLRGATLTAKKRQSTRHFNPRSPCGERLIEAMRSTYNKIFQSALPLRGATLSTFKAVLNAIFQSALPLRGATPGTKRHRQHQVISIRAPLAGSDTD